MPKVKFLMEPLNPESSPVSAELYSAGYRWTFIVWDIVDGYTLVMDDFKTAQEAREYMFKEFKNANRRV